MPAKRDWGDKRLPIRLIGRFDKLFFQVGRNLSLKETLSPLRNASSVHPKCIRAVPGVRENNAIPAVAAITLP